MYVTFANVFRIWLRTFLMKDKKKMKLNAEFKHKGKFFLCGLRCSLGCHVMSLFIYLFNFCLAFQMSPNMYFIISSDCTSTAPPPTLLYLSQTQSHDQNGWRRGVFWAENRKRKRENAKLCIKMRTVTSLWINRDY